jgi:hypothetical protein
LQTTKRQTYGLLLRSRLLLGCSLFGSSLLLGSLLGLSGGLGLLLEGRAQLVRSFDLDEISGRNSLLERLEESPIHPLLVGGHVGLHVLLDGNGGGAGPILELRDGFDDSCFV